MDAPVTFATIATGIMPQGMAQMLLVIMVVGVGVLLTITIRARIARRNADAPTPREQIEAIKASGAARIETDAVHASLHEVARKLSAQLDNKAERLEQLIVQAEARIARLEALDGAENRAPRPSVAESVDERAKQNDESVPRPSPAKPHATAAITPRETEAPDALRRAVYALADTGRSAIDISRELDEHVGKVELILALRHG